MPRTNPNILKQNITFALPADDFVVAPRRLQAKLWLLPDMGHHPDAPHIAAPTKTIRQEIEALVDQFNRLGAQKQRYKHRPGTLEDPRLLGGQRADSLNHGASFLY